MTDILRLSVPLAAWLAGFSAVYGLQGLSCSRHWPEGLPERPVLLAAWALAVLVQAALLMGVLRSPSPQPFTRTVSVALAVTALVAALWTLMPASFASACL